MKKRSLFKSIYLKFTFIFLGIKWGLDSLTLVVILHLMKKSNLSDLPTRVLWMKEFIDLRKLTGLSFMISTMIGTIIILIAIRGIVQPIKRLSSSSKEVAKGNFDIEVNISGDDELGQLTADFNLMTAELKNIDIIRKDFVSNVSHEFKTPITSIQGYAKLIRDGNLTKQQLEEYSDIIVNESDRLSKMATSMLQLSELDSRVIREKAKPFSLDEQIRKVILLLEMEWSQKGIEWDIDLEDIDYVGNENLMSQVWVNLIQNAVKFSRPDGLIQIKLKLQNKKAVFIITDHGCGISEQDIEHIFERFYKADRSRTNEGYGLGLVIVRKIIELSKGSIHVESEKDRYTTFVVELPM